jgi:hypothetical protein
MRGGASEGAVNVDEIIAWRTSGYYTPPDLARFALDILAVPPKSDQCERLLGGASILLQNRHQRLQIGYIEANKD